ncbi:RCC1/BLIP-II [Choiromyces venosus 120613-1]|uniref:RCC1/BLIP-II n=1 Tax=Choiromyces venosus 120613-1 TaxID=1336337 RepID=A0A3N4JRZ0_9PEZI|nr:RCC1/BLIP-II [Choiromyces venosus 120613-1]
MLYAFGSNGRGQLSLGHLEDAHTPTPCLIPSLFPSIPSRKIAAGGNHTVLLFPSGECFVAGDNTENQCCLPSATFPSLTTFHPLSNDHRWEHVSAGWSFTVLIDYEGKVFVSGNGQKGELGLGERLHDAILEEITDFSPGKVVQVASGMAHTLLLTASGDVWGWGAGRKGQLGEPAQSIVSRPRKVEVGFSVGKLDCGKDFSILVNRDNPQRIEILGNDRYQIGPSLASWRGAEILDIQASWNGVYLLETSGTIKASGKNDRGQLPPPNLENVTDMAVGSEHALAITEDKTTKERKIIAWGWGEHGNCGKPGGGDVVGEVFALDIPTPENVRIGAGCATSFIWAEE